MIQRLTLLTLLISIPTYSHIRSPIRSANLSSSDSAMIFTTNVSIQNITLNAREDRLPPLGKPIDHDRNIGFADVFLKIENPKQEPITLVIHSIEIQDSNSAVQLASQSPQEFHLKPLENSVNDFHLTNKTGYLTQGKVKAVINYQIAGVTHIAESSLVEISRQQPNFST